MLRALRAIVDEDSRPDAARGRQPRPRLLRRHRREHSTHVRRHGRHGQPRRAADRARRAGRDPRHRRGPRALATRFETAPQPFLVKGKERAITAYSVGARQASRRRSGLRSCRSSAAKLELAELAGAVAAARMRQGQVVEIVGEPGIGKSRLVEELKTQALGFTQLVARCDQYGMSVPYFPFRSLLRPLAGITEPESAAEAGARLKPWIEAVMPDFAPWLPLLAIPFDAEVPTTPETEEIEPAFRRERVLQGGRGLPAPRADDAHAHRLRGHPLDRRRLAQCAPPSRAEHGTAALATGNHSPAARPAGSSTSRAKDNG